MDTNKDEFNIPSIIVDPRTKTQYSKGRFLGKVCSIERKKICVHCYWIFPRVVLRDVMN